MFYIIYLLQEGSGVTLNVTATDYNEGRKIIEFLTTISSRYPSTCIFRDESKVKDINSDGRFEINISYRMIPRNSCLVCNNN